MQVVMWRLWGAPFRSNYAGTTDFGFVIKRPKLSILLPHQLYLRENFSVIHISENFVI